MYIKPSILLLLAIVHIILLISGAKPTFSWLNKGASWQLHRLRLHHRSHEHNKQQEKRTIDDSVHPTPSVSYQKSSPLKSQGVTPSVENQKRARNFFGVK